MSHIVTTSSPTKRWIRGSTGRTATRIVLFFAAIFNAHGCGAGLTLRTPAPAMEQTTALVRAARQRLHREGDPRGAARLARRALGRDPHLGQAHAVLARVALLAGDEKAAFNHLLQALADGRDRDTASHLDRIPLSNLGRLELRTLARLLAEVAREHPAPQSRAEALSYLIRVQLLLGDTAAAERLLQRRTLLTNWQGIGGFDNEDGKGFDVPFPPEREIALDRAYVAERGKVHWRRVTHRGPEPAIELDEFFYPFKRNTAYLVTWVDSPRTQDVTLEITSSTPVKAWLNDRNVLSSREVRHSRHRQFLIPVQLKRGANKLLLKSCVDEGTWRVGAWFSRGDGTPLALRESATPRSYQRDPGPPRAPPLPPVVSPPAGKSPWEQLWQALALASAGLRPTALDRFGRHLQLFPRDPLALYFAARLHEAEGQLQRASLLIERGTRLAAPYNARFLVAAARLYRRRGQYDKSFTALSRAQSASPGAERLIARSLDQLYARKGWTLDRRRLALRLREKHPDWVWPASVLARCSHALDRSGQEVHWLRQAVRLSPADERLRDRLVRVLLRRGQCTAALQEQRATTRLRVNRAFPHLRLARTLRACGKLDQALTALDGCIERIPDWPAPYELKGKILHEQGHTEEAIEQWSISLEHNPNNVKLWDRLSHLRPDRDPVLKEFAPGQERIAEVIRRGARIKPVEGSSVIWLLDHEVSRLMPDGTFKRVVTTVRKAVDRAGRDSLGEARLPRSGLVKVLEAYTIDRLGRRREVTSMHSRTVRYPTLEEGATVVLQYRHIKRPSGYLRHHLASHWYFQHNLEQAVEARWILAIPPERKLHLYMQGKISHRVTERHGLRVHEFASLDVPPLRPEPSSPPTRDLLRMVAVSTVPSWDYFSEWGNSLTSEVFAMDGDLKKTISELVAGKRDIPAKINAIYHFALTRVRYQQDYETFIAGVKPHTASAVLARGYGDCKDKSVLMIAMLRHLGLKANLALIRTRPMGRVLAEVPSQQFNHAVVYMPPQPGLKQGRFLDATAENLDIDVLRPDIQGTLALVLFSDGYRLIKVPYQPPEANRFQVDVELALQPSGAVKARLRLLAKGVLAGRVRKPLQNHQMMQQYAQAVVNQLYPDCSMGRVAVDGTRTILKPLTLMIEATCPDAARKEDGLLRLGTPALLAAPTGAARWTERRHPLLLGPPDLMLSRLTVKLPADHTFRSHPQPLSATHPCVTIDGRWQEKGPQELSYIQSVRRTCPEVSPERYPSFRSRLNALKRYLETELVIAPPEEGKGKNGKKGKKGKK